MRINKLALFIGVISYFALSFTFKSVGLSFFDDLTFNEYRIVEMITTWLATIVSGYIILCTCEFNETYSSVNSQNAGIWLTVITIGLYFIPISVGSVILLNIINLGFITILAIYEKEQ